MYYKTIFIYNFRVALVMTVSLENSIDHIIVGAS